MLAEARTAWLMSVEALPVEGFQDAAILEQEAHVEHGAAVQERAPADVAAVVTVADVDARGTADLPGHVAHAGERASRDTDDAREVDVEQHQRIDDALRVEPAERPALQDEAALGQPLGRVPGRNAVELRVRPVSHGDASRDSPEHHYREPSLRAEFSFDFSHGGAMMNIRAQAPIVRGRAVW